MLQFTKLEKKGYFKAFESQIMLLKTLDARHGAVGFFLFFFSLGFGLFDQSFFAIYSHSSLWNGKLYSMSLYIRGIKHGILIMEKMMVKRLLYVSKFWTYAFEQN